MSEEKKQAARIQTSILNAAEKKVLVWLAERMPSWVTSDMLTFVGFIGALVVAAGYALSNLSLYWMWLSCLGLFINWFGDSLDGSLARVRNTQRKTYGFFIDHNVDVINETIMFIGVGCNRLPPQRGDAPHLRRPGTHRVPDYPDSRQHRLHVHPLAHGLETGCGAVP